MPFYRLKTGLVHVRGTKLPPPCSARVLVDGEQVRCMAPSEYLCDGPSTTDPRSTCDAALCEAHAHRFDVNRHHCPSCHLAHSDASGQRSLFTSLV
ncbi:hypothetical protein QRO08_03605 [Paracidovorax citrulli]|uniref:Uncharacterized protein n=2 Tax=Paracidovorax citrulli TaxID=80869 RepID=A1TUN4_PARC0|nr:hypothetical protein [Paracidovorax citrulli]ABM34672.1 conserved hypothetical protein [Paracidovorax citrulli AAC00-1]ATG96745.1 hypothetical protein CQB05_24270 [Paracidovorax citrulli]MVT28735.1 hypothetical protein [Paracidovorax citrulli]MVT37403.1 hypothetical protein [Paracidovorax citrulli]PVY64119.1 hypothetical protein C8E08_1430 [Paracidovorax citrulli]